jgi:hypothetical protein
MHLQESYSIFHLYHYLHKYLQTSALILIAVLFCCRCLKDDSNDLPRFCKMVLITFKNHPPNLYDVELFIMSDH